MLSLLKKMKGQVRYHKQEVPRMLLLGFTKERHSKARPTQKRYYTTSVVRHWYVI